MMSDFRFICLDCRCEFNHPDSIEESRGEFWGTPCYETMYYCPACGSEAFREADEVEEDDFND